MMRRTNVLSVLLVFLMTMLLVACANSARPVPPAATAPATPQNATAATPTANPDPTAIPEADGDGTLSIRLNVLNPEQAQAQYSVFFTASGQVQVGQALSDNAFIGPFMMDVADELVIDIEQDLQNFLPHQRAG
jgi:hypothetical protein